MDCFPFKSRVSFPPCVADLSNYMVSTLRPVASISNPPSSIKLNWIINGLELYSSCMNTTEAAGCTADKLFPSPVMVVDREITSLVLEDMYGGLFVSSIRTGERVPTQHVPRTAEENVEVGISTEQELCVECMKEYEASKGGCGRAINSVLLKEYYGVGSCGGTPWMCIQCCGVVFCEKHESLHRQGHPDDGHHVFQLFPFPTFPSPITLNEAILEGFRLFAKRPFLSIFRTNQWLTFEDVLFLVCCVYDDLADQCPQSFVPGGYVGMAMGSGIPWVITDIACALRGCVTVPIDTPDGVQRCRDLGLPLEFVLEQSTADALVQQAMVRLKDAARKDSVLSTAKERFVTSNVQDSQLFALLWSSGTTGARKLVQYKRATWVSKLLSQNPQPGSLHCTIRLIYSPLHMTAARQTLWRAIFQGGPRVFVEPQDVFEAIPQCNPSGVYLVPMLWDALKMKVGHRTNIPKEVLVGSRCTVIGTGTAPISKATFEWMQTTFGPNIHVLDGYGSTETGNIASNGTVRAKNIKVDADGVLCVKTSHMFDGYFGDPEGSHLDAEGYYRTSDIVQFDPDTNSVKIVGRASSVTKLSNGKFCHPELIEGACANIPGIVMSYAHVLEEGFVVLIVVLNEATLSHTPDIPSLHKQVMNACKPLGSQNIPIQIIVATEPFTAENGLRTFSLKLKRTAVAQKYRDELLKVKETLASSWRDAVQGLNIPTGGGDVGHVDSMTAMLLAGRMVGKLGVAGGLIALESLNRMAHAATAREQQQERDFTRELAALPEVTLDGVCPTFPTTQDIQTVVLTGATGLVGCHILVELFQMLNSPTLQVTCLVRGDKPVERLKEVCRSYGHNAFANSAIWTNGQLTVTSEEASETVDPVHVVIDCAAHVDFLSKYEELAPANVDRAVNLRKRYAHAQKYVFISTKSVKNVSISGSGYAQSKCVAERAVVSAVPKTTTQIIRLGYIWCNRQGYGNPKDMYHRITKAMMMTKSAVEYEYGGVMGKVLVPVDDCAKAILAHVCSTSRTVIEDVGESQWLSYDALVKAVFDSDDEKKARRIPFEEWVDEVMMQTTANPMFMLSSRLRTQEGQYMMFWKTLPEETKRVMKRAEDDILTKSVSLLKQSFTVNSA
eukprot:PhF_6_TR29395/c0_g1_i1/m.43373